MAKIFKMMTVLLMGTLWPDVVALRRVTLGRSAPVTRSFTSTADLGEAAVILRQQRVSIGLYARDKSSGGSLPIVVAGLAGGVAESIACALIEQGRSSSVTTVLDRPPFSPILSAVGKSSMGCVYFGQDINSLTDLATNQDYRGQVRDLMDGRVLITTDDAGDEVLRIKSEGDKKKEENMGDRFLSKIASDVSPSLLSIICLGRAQADQDKKGLAGMFGPRGKESLRSWCEKNNRPFTGLLYGKLIGGVPGAEPLPFTSLPLQDPELHPSYVLQSLVCSPASNNKYASSELCTRASLAEVVTQALSRSAASIGGQTMSSSTDSAATPLSGGDDTLVVSIAGPPLTGADWDRIFKRLQRNGDAELLRIEFGQINKPVALVRWLCDSWFPQALIGADAATILRGARPVRASVLPTSTSTAAAGTAGTAGTGAGTGAGGAAIVRLEWEDIQPNLSVLPAGALELQVVSDASPPYLSVQRRQAPGSGAGAALPGEGQLMDRLIEAVNKDVYWKQFCTPLKG